jgi:hypothetical protein
MSGRAYYGVALDAAREIAEISSSPWLMDTPLNSLPPWA